MAVTIADIAREANVSIATVSRVINGTKAVSPELKQRVMETVEKHHFMPNTFARGLAKDESSMIGVIVTDISNNVISTTIKGINDVCQKRGYTVMICESDGDGEKEQMLLNRLGIQKASGVLLAGMHVDAGRVQEMLKMDFPIVMVTQQSSDGRITLNTVIHNNVDAIRDAVSFLVTNGHRQIAFICGPREDYSSGQRRLLGFRRACEEFGLEIPDSYIIFGDFSFDSGQDCMKKIYEENAVLPTAVLVCSDLMAMGAVSAASNLGLSVPDDLSIMGFDDSDLARYSRPALSTVRIPYFDEGRLAAEELFRLIETGIKADGKLTYVPHKVIRRFSVKKI
ncbi:MAG: LacI family DNA-binding transcriptional regulator [Lachnospiraceae bacterium]|nr:LacI family DNA-binding transcriptional regulator [Lachnospiraceae bacterium]